MMLMTIAIMMRLLSSTMAIKMRGSKSTNKRKTSAHGLSSFRKIRQKNCGSNMLMWPGEGIR